MAIYTRSYTSFCTLCALDLEKYMRGDLGPRELCWTLKCPALIRDLWCQVREANGGAQLIETWIPVSETLYLPSALAIVITNSRDALLGHSPSPAPVLAHLPSTTSLLTRALYSIHFTEEENRDAERLSVATFITTARRQQHQNLMHASCLQSPNH